MGVEEGKGGCWGIVTGGAQVVRFVAASALGGPGGGVDRP